MSVVYAVLQAWQTVQATAISTYLLDAPYEFNSTQIGLMNLAPFIGNTLGSLICGPLSDWLILRLAKRNKGVYEPEMRIWIFVPFIPFQIAGTFWFGYALQDGQSWLAIAWAWGLCGFGSAPILSIALTYMTDAYNEVSRLLRSQWHNCGRDKVPILTAQPRLVLGYRRRFGGSHFLAQRIEHHLRVHHDALGGCSGHCQLVQHSGSHRPGGAPVCICRHLARQEVAL